MNVITRGIRNAFRNKIRTLSVVLILGLSIGLALTMLVARQAVTTKINSVKASVGNTVSVSPAGVRGFEGGGNALTGSQISGLGKIAHVTSVDETLNDRLTSSNSNLASAISAGNLGQRFARNSGVSGGTAGPSLSGGGAGGAGFGGGALSFTPPVIVTGTTNPGTLSSDAGGGALKITSGKLIPGTGSDNVAMVGKSLAKKNNLEAGSTFTAYNTTITVAGIFDAGNAFANNQVIMPLGTVQQLSAQPGSITGATVYVDSIANVDSVTSAAGKQLGSAADVTNDATRAKQAVAPLANIQTISLYSLIGAVVAGSVIILLTMVMIVRERRREIGVIKAIGASNVTVMGQFAAEAVTFTLLSSAVGIIFGVIAGNPVTRLLVNNSDTAGRTVTGRFGGGAGRAFGAVGRNVTNISATVGWGIIIYGLLVALVIALVGSMLTSFFIAKIRPAEVMRVE